MCIISDVLAVLDGLRRLAGKRSQAGTRKQLWYLFLKYFVVSDESILIHVQVQIFLTEEIKLLRKKPKTNHPYLSVCI